MAKLKAPLLSLGAAGAIGKAIVYFGWKGLDVAREYVVPANPRSGRQGLVRGYFKNAVIAVHAAQADTDHPLAADDQTAYAALASLRKAAMTWFNIVVGQWISQRWKGHFPMVFKSGHTSVDNEQLELVIYSAQIGAGECNDAKFVYGTSKSNLINTKDATVNTVDKNCRATLTELTNGVKYFWQLVPETALYKDAVSGIYYGVPKAP